MLTVKFKKSRFTTAETKTFDSLEAASKAYRARNTEFEGASTFPPATVILEDGSKGYISYNGRVWRGTPQKWTPETECLYPPKKD